MKYADLVITAIYGLFWLVFGLNNFLHFFPIPEPSAAGANFIQGLDSAGYVMPLVYGTQIIAGLMLLVRRFMPLALLILAPVVANIVLFDLFLNPGGLTTGAVITALYVFLLFRNRQAFMIFLKP
jgi:putative oxidoreductase